MAAGLIPNSSPSVERPAESSRPAAAAYLVSEYEGWHRLFETQPAILQRSLEDQGRALAELLVEPAGKASFSLAAEVVLSAENRQAVPVPEELREQRVGGLASRLMRTGLIDALRTRLDELEAGSDQAAAAAAGLLRFTTALALVYDSLPSGRSVRYRAGDGEENPSIPVDADELVDSAFTAAADAIAVETNHEPDARRGDVLVPFAQAARRFFLPQWVAFDERDALIVNSPAEAEAHVGSMQRYLRILHSAASLAPYILADPVYQQKRYGMLGQLINQGRALARFQTCAIIATIRRRAAENGLNRGLSLSLPYFDDQTLELRLHDFDIIPGGRIMFLPAFVVLAAHKEHAKVDQDTRLSRSTRNHLLAELAMLEASFQSDLPPSL